MEKVTINGKNYQLDVEKCKKEGLLVEEKKYYPKTWSEFWVNCTKESHTDNCLSKEENNALFALKRLIILRDWWWDNMCDGWRPNWNDNKTKYLFYIDINNKFASTWNKVQHILAFPDNKIGDLFFEAYRDLIEEAKIFL